MFNIMSIKETKTINTQENYIIPSNNTDYYIEALDFVSKEISSITEEQIMIYRGMATGDIVDEEGNLITKGKVHLSNLVNWVKSKYKDITAKFTKEDKEIKESYSILQEGLENGLVFNNIKNVNPICMSEDTSITELKEGYDELSKTNDYISGTYDLSIKLENIIREIDRVIYNEGGSLFGENPLSSYDSLKNSIQSIAICVASLCEAVEDNYFLLEENNYYKTKDVISVNEVSKTFGIFSKGKYNYDFYNKDSSKDITNGVKSRGKILGTVDKFVDLNAELKYINNTLPKLRKTLVNLKFDYEEYCKLSKEEQVKKADFINNTEHSIYYANKLVKIFFLNGFDMSKPDVYDVESVKANARYNISELERCIKYLEKRKKQIERQKLREGK